MATALALISVMMPFYSSSASADNYRGATGNTGCQGLNRQDNSTMTWYRGGLTSAMHHAVGDVMVNDVDATNINRQPEESQQTLNTDVVLYDDNYTTEVCGFDWHPDSDGDGESTIAHAECMSLTPIDRCQRFIIRFDTSFTNSTHVATRKTLACHEIAHTFSLAHIDKGCLPRILPSNSHFFATHNRQHINCFCQNP